MAMHAEFISIHSTVLLQKADIVLEQIIKCYF